MGGIWNMKNKLKEFFDWLQMIVLLLLFVVIGLPVMLIGALFFIVIMLIGSILVLTVAIFTSPYKLYVKVQEMEEKKNENNRKGN